jgi:hypothetical protein
LAISYDNFPAWSHQDIHSRSKFHQPNALPCRDEVAGPFVTNNPASDQARNQAKDYRAPAGINPDGALLIFGRSRFQTGDVKLPLCIRHLVNSATNRTARHVHIKNIKKDAKAFISARNLSNA